MAHRHSAAWEQATVLESILVADTVRRIVLDVPGHPARSRAGAHLDVVIPASKREIIRSYSVVDDGRRPEGVSIAVRLAPHSRGGSTFMHTLQAGDALRVSPPLRSFALTTRRVPCVLLAGGIGITPLIGMARVLRDRGQDYQLHYAGRRGSDMPFLTELRADHPDRVHIAVDERGERVDIPKLVEGLAPAAELYVCGPPGMLAAAARAWAADGRPAGLLRFESFGSGGTQPAEPFDVWVPRLGIRTRVPAESTAAEALERAGAEVMTDCLRGECGLCVVPVLEVDCHLDHRDVFLSQRQKNLDTEMALCVSRATGGTVCVDLPRRPGP
ncbi:PDR/VanB family oxidoreductase [Amycolatopsis sp. H20-H5]|uniref:PDR/VanB family oxidoreductase n=1 Tax=Amycolatopsis sp. H20-H5 TaxID=3046309 RepID=UPI002DB642CA|nr:PDR/VanB family oxidoreductase [Amycolatopsis sp. H20-H5]MEC3981010.1 PDR/VanB family oxidoreductase [Amycolatopsis sp. H20-H5]